MLKGKNPLSKYVVLIAGLSLLVLSSCGHKNESIELTAVAQEFENGNFEECLGMLSDVYLADLTDSIAYYKLQGLCLFELNRYTEALVVLERIDTIKEADSDLWIALGQINDSIGNLDEALKNYSKAIAIEGGKSSVILNSRGLVHARLEEFSLAIIDFKRAIALDPNNSKAYNNLGLVYEHMHDYDSAIVCYTKSIELNETEHVVYFNRGVSYMYMDDFVGAIEDFSQAILLKDDVGSYYHNRAMAYYLLGESSKACKDWETASENGEKVATTYLAKYCYSSIRL